MNKIERKKLITDVALHFGQRVSCEWLSSDGVEWTFWDNAEVTVPFLINVEKGYVRNITVGQPIVAVRATLITTYRTFKEWQDNPPSVTENPLSGRVLYVDRSHKTLTTEEEFRFARDNDLFPVCAYRMMKTTEDI